MNPCPSCPFLKDNHEEFGVIAKRLCARFGKPEPDFWDCLSIRASVVNEAIEHGHLQCHCTVYDAEMNPHPEGSMPCAGLENHIQQRKTT